MEIGEIVKAQRDFFATGKTLEIGFRKNALDRLAGGLEKFDREILAALKADLNKSGTEAFITETGLLKKEISLASRSLPSWTKPRRLKSPLLLFPGKSRQYSEPYGVALIMSPWNYPVLLTLQPLVGAIAAGNCAVLKPSAYAPRTAEVLAALVSHCFSPEHCTVIPGGRRENSELLNQRFDYIFFTGGTAVGRLVMESASRFLTPVTLELGGKSPVIVDETADINLAARRLVFGKFINAGQTCVAPDYVLVHRSRRDQLLSLLEKYIKEYYPKDSSGFIADYPKIINEKHFDRLLGLMKDQNIVFGGGSRRAGLTIEPAILADPKPHSPVMEEEIFGPLLPVITYDNIDEALREIQSRSKPLALYLFTSDRNLEARVVKEISFGGGCVNDCLLHVSSSFLPFGGVGESGMGRYHGKSSFDTFSHKKSVLLKGRLDFSFRYRPYDKKKERLLRRIL